MTPLLVAVTDATRPLAEHVAAYETLSLSLGERLLVLVRLPGCDARVFLDWAGALSRAGLPLSIADRIDVACALGLRAVHLGESGVDARDARTLLGPAAWITRACHDPEKADRDADALLLSPIFETPGKGTPLGLGAIARVCRPVIALGGVTSHNARACLSAGAVGVAAIRACLDEPGALAEALLAGREPADA